MNTAQNPDEVFDVVDADDCVVGQATRAEVHRRKLLHRAVHIFVFDAQGRLYLQKRSILKDTCPGLYTTSCAGHVDSGESYDTAAVRELDEELGIRLPAGTAPEFLFKCAPCEETGMEFLHVYRLDWPGEITANPAEISGELRLSIGETDTFFEKTPELSSPSLLFVWRKFRAGNSGNNKPSA